MPFLKEKRVFPREKLLTDAETEFIPHEIPEYRRYENRPEQDRECEDMLRSKHPSDEEERITRQKNPRNNPVSAKTMKHTPANPIILISSGRLTPKNSITRHMMN
jgi:hypothetical protein